MMSALVRAAILDMLSRARAPEAALENPAESGSGLSDRDRHA
jgi:hypothetical protein